MTDDELKAAAEKYDDSGVGNAYLGYLAGHRSRDAEVAALKQLADDRLQFGTVDVLTHEDLEPDNAMIAMFIYDKVKAERDFLRAELARAKAVIKAATKLKARWDHHGAFYKPSDVDPVLKDARAYLAETTKGEGNE